jgi:hypothetical protein
MGPDAQLTIEADADGDGATVTFNDGHSDPREICWLAPEASYADLVWLVKGAGQFHGIPVYES